MKISFCIPLYNKAFAIQETVESIAKVCEKYSIDYEIKISNNGSTDISNQELKNRLSMYKNIDIIYIPKTISAPENWFLALNLGDGDIIKLHLADDLLNDFDISSIINMFQNDDLDYVIGKTMASFEDEKYRNTYFDDVNNFRSLINKNLTLEDKIKIIEKNGIYSGVNLFGDINALYFRKDCIEILKNNFKYNHPSLRAFLDFEIYLRIFITKKGQFFDTFVATYDYNSSSPAIRAQHDTLYMYQTFSFMTNMFIYEFINDMFYRDVLNKMSIKTKFKIVFTLIKRIKDLCVLWLK